MITEDVLAPFSLDATRRALAARGDRATLILAGPGAGKTHLLVAHAVWLAAQQAGRVVLLTYSRKAATEMKRRADAMLPLSNRRLVVATTIHAHALDILRSHGHRMGLQAELQPLDAREVQDLADTVARRDGLPMLDDFAERFERYQRVKGDMAAPRLPPLVSAVDREMRATGRLDWDSCIRLATDLIRKHADVRASIRHHDRNVLVDEAQDCDANQLAFLEQLVGPPPGECHLFVVMDPDQSLYAFREAKPEIVRAWAKAYSHEESEITENFRCLPRVQAVAAHVLDRAWAGPLEPGLATLVEAQTRKSEACWVADDLARRLSLGRDPNRVAVLARRRSRLGDVEAALEGRVPIRSDPRERWDAMEDRVLAAVAFVKCWRDGISTPDIVSTFLINVMGLTPGASLEFQEQALQRARHPAELLPESWWQSFSVWLEDRRSPEQVVAKLGEALGAQPSELDSLRAIAGLARSLGDLLRVARAGPDPSLAASSTGVLVTSFHGAKGLEFETVYVVGCEDGTIPDFRARADADITQERRALYVAITRARCELVLTRVNAEQGYRKKLSRFLPPANDSVWNEVVSP